MSRGEHLKEILDSGYYATFDGRVFSTKSRINCPRELTSYDRKGYREVGLYDPINKKSVLRKVHTIVWTYFNGPIPDDLQINHKNGIKSDNRLENLEICTPKENTSHAWANGLVKTRRGGIKLNEKQVREIKRLLEQKVTLEKIAKKYSVSFQNISNIKRGLIWRCK